MNYEERRAMENRVGECDTQEKVTAMRQEILALPESEPARPDLAEQLTMVATGRGLKPF